MPDDPTDNFALFSRRLVGGAHKRANGPVTLMPDPIPISRKSEALEPVFEPLRTGPWLQLRYPHGFEWNRVKLPVPGLPASLSGMRIVHLSDLHLGAGWGRCYDELIDRVNGSSADLVLITGDIVEDKFDHRNALPTAEKLLGALQSKNGVCSVLGNHDTDLLLQRLRDWGVQPLDGRIATVEVRGGRVRLVGLPGVSPRDYSNRDPLGSQPESALTGSGVPQAQELRIVLSHYPVHVQNVRHLAPHLFLCGHTHGGQVCLPGGVAIITHSRLRRPYHRGIHRIHDTWLVINRGFGFATVPIRLFCPAEVIELDLHPA
jgi:predicted MPP superfamily phosphohydrolase